MNTILIRLNAPSEREGHTYQTSEILDLDAADALPLVSSGAATELPRTSKYLERVTRV
jgi:hypothetical protein